MGAFAQKFPTITVASVCFSRLPTSMIFLKSTAMHLKVEEILQKIEV